MPGQWSPPSPSNPEALIQVSASPNPIVYSPSTSSSTDAQDETMDKAKEKLLFALLEDIDRIVNASSSTSAGRSSGAGSADSDRPGGAPDNSTLSFVKSGGSWWVGGGSQNGFELGKNKRRLGGEHELVASEGGSRTDSALVEGIPSHAQGNNNAKRFQCSWEGCSATYSRQRDRDAHRMTKHQVELSERLKCPQKGCLKSFYAADLLQLHLGTHEAYLNSDSIKCKSCKVGFTTEEELTEHDSEYHAERVICTWEGCGKVYNYACYLKAHMRSHTGDLHTCPHPGCTRRFVGRGDLWRHNKHHGLNTEFTCEPCQTSYKSAEALVVHRGVFHKKPKKSPLQDRRTRAVVDPQLCEME